MTIILGTAHGSDVGGKCSPDKKLREYQWSREMCMTIKKNLEEYIIWNKNEAASYSSVLLPDAYSNKDLKFIVDSIAEKEKDLNIRINEANKKITELKGDCIYISIHINAAGNNGWGNAHGWTVWVSETNATDEEKELALYFYNEASNINYKNNETPKNLFGNRYIPPSHYFDRNFGILRETKCPAVMTENMFQTNMDDVNFLKSDLGREKICVLHMKAILKYLKDKNKFELALGPNGRSDTIDKSINNFIKMQGIEIFKMYGENNERLTNANGQYAYKITQIKTPITQLA